jgi:hypothetical protein
MGRGAAVPAPPYMRSAAMPSPKNTTAKRIQLTFFMGVVLSIRKEARREPSSRLRPPP